MTAHRQWLCDRARGLLEFAERHEARGNGGAVDEAGRDLDALFAELEQIDNVRRADVAEGRLDELGATPVREFVVRGLRARLSPPPSRRVAR